MEIESLTDISGPSDTSKMKNSEDISLEKTQG